MRGGLKFGAVCWGQYAEWLSVLEAGRSADRLGYTSLWTTDHLYPIHGSRPGPVFEGWLTLAAWAVATMQVRLGLMVAANTFREPALTAKMAATLDHISGGRAILGIGAGWNEAEHQAFGLPFGSGPPERLRWLGEALPIMRGMLDGSEPTATGPRYRSRSTHNRPPPIQRRLPILVGGSGEIVTLRLVARWADMNNIGGGPAVVRSKEEVLVRHCLDVGRDPAEIERTVGVGTVFIRDRRDDAERMFRAALEQNGGARLAGQPVGTPEDVAALLGPYPELGYRHIIAEFPAPHDVESMTRLITDVGPLLAR